MCEVSGSGPNTTTMRTRLMIDEVICGTRNHPIYHEDVFRYGTFVRISCTDTVPRFLNRPSEVTKYKICLHIGTVRLHCSSVVARFHL